MIMNSAGSRDHVILVSLTISFFFHLSMVTLFRIVIYFPQEKIEYYDLSIIQASPRSAFAQTLQKSLDVPSAQDAEQRLSQSSPSYDRWANLPPVNLPTLQFSEFDLIRLSQTGLNTRSRYQDLFEHEADDLWARFGKKLSLVGDILDRSGQDDPIEVDKPMRILAGHPAPGFEALLEWMSTPYDRQPLIVQKIQALWGANPSLLPEPIILIFRVNRDGRVTFVQMPIEDKHGIVDSSAQAIFKYRFEPLLGDGTPFQHGTLIIQAENTRP